MIDCSRDHPNLTYARDSYPYAALTVGRLLLGQKWVLSGTGDAHANDDWLRLFHVSGSGYYGGLAAAKLYTPDGSVQGSDARLKKDITNLGKCLDQLLSLRGVRFAWNDARRPPVQHIGLIAQEVEEIFPELVEVGPDGMKAVNYTGLIPPLIEALKEQQARMAQLEEAIQAWRT
jgi:hypothetical protein